LDAAQAWLLNEAAFFLRALGRLMEAREPLKAGLEMYIEQKVWKFAAIVSGNLSELDLTLGEVSEAIAHARQSVNYADRSKDAFQRMGKRTTHADALHQASRDDQAQELFAEAEAMQAERQKDYPWLYSLWGFRYCDLLLSRAERAAWRLTLALGSPADPGAGLPEDREPDPDLLRACDQVFERAKQTLEWAKQYNLSLLDIALDHLTLGRAAMVRALLERGASDAGSSAFSVPQYAIDNITAAVLGLRKAGAMNHLPRGLLTRAWQRQLMGDAKGARADLDEAWEIAERGPMLLHQADILLTRARLFFWEDPEAARAHLAQARRLIKKCGYHRRDEELQDADQALERWEVGLR